MLHDYGFGHGLRRRRPLRALVVVGLAMALTGGCSMASNARPACFTRVEGVELPRRDLVLAALSHGQKGRELYDAVTRGDSATALALIKADPDLLNLAVAPPDQPQHMEVGQVGDLLTFAVTACQPKMLAELIDAGAPLKAGYWQGTALGFALLADTPDMAELLLQMGADPNVDETHEVANLVRDTLAFGQVGAIRMLIRHGLNVKHVNQFGSGYLDTALAMEQYISAEDLVKAGADPWLIGMGGAMPVHLLTQSNILPSSPEQLAAKERLIQLVQRPGLPWPPPPPAEIKAKVLSGEWPTPAQKAAGMTISPQGLKTIQDQAAREAAFAKAQQQQ